MSRYLTPAKIGLITLIELYVQGLVPAEAICPVVNFLASHLLDCDLQNAPDINPAQRWKQAKSAIRLVVSIRDFEKLLAAWPAADGIPGSRLWDRFLEKLWGIDSLDGMHEFFGWLPNLVVRTREELRRMAEVGEAPPGPEQGVLFRLRRTSPFGGFIRRAHFESARMPFDHAAELWKMLVRYRQPTAAYWRRRYPQYGRLGFDSVLVAGEREWGLNRTMELAVGAYGKMLLAGDHERTLPVSTDDVEGLLEWQVAQIQSEFFFFLTWWPCLLKYARIWKQNTARSQGAVPAAGQGQPSRPEHVALSKVRRSCARPNPKC